MLETKEELKDYTGQKYNYDSGEWDFEWNECKKAPYGTVLVKINKTINGNCTNAESNNANGAKYNHLAAGFVVGILGILAGI